jgi:putative CocE/NonD family hydrolase
MPEKMEKPLPAIMVLTPYNNDHNTRRGIYFAKNGYVFVTVDCRGRGDSEGIFTPFENAGIDGYDAVEWIAKQKWCNGKVATMGGSYKGMDQWLIAKNHPPHLVTMAPTATVCPGIDATRDRNIYRTYNLNIMSYVAGHIRNKENFFSEYNIAKVKRNYRDHLPYADLLTALDSPNKQMQKVFKRWISHPTFDSFWKDMLPSKEDFEKFNMPILSITGYFDSDQPGHMYYYDHFQKYASEEAKSKMYFVIGPWDHSGTRRPVSGIGGLEFTENAVVNIFKLHKEWFDYTMKNGEKPDFLKDHVSYFEMGTNKWNYCSDLEGMSDQTLSYYLSSPSVNPQDIFQSGSLVEKPVNEKETDHVIYDPSVPAFKGSGIGRNYLTSQAYVTEEGWLYYHTPVFREELEISGFVTLNVFAEINTKDTDFDFKLYEIKADGTNVYLGNGVMRARFRNTLEKEELIKPGEVNEYQIKTLNMFNRTISKGSRLRLMFGYLDSDQYQKNYNSGKDVSYETLKDAKTCTIKVHCSKKYPSSLSIPILKK